MIFHGLVFYQALCIALIKPSISLYQIFFFFRPYSTWYYVYICLYQIAHVKGKTVFLNSFLVFSFYYNNPFFIEKEAHMKMFKNIIQDVVIYNKVIKFKVFTGVSAPPILFYLFPWTYQGQQQSLYWKTKLKQEKFLKWC